MINYTIACKLRDSLLKHSSFSDFHSLPSVDAAVEVIQQAGLAAAYIPLAKTTRTSKSPKYEMHLAVIDPQDTLILNPDQKLPPTLVYALVHLVPSIDYAADLVEMDLSRLWWSAPTFFWSMVGALAPGCQSNHNGGRSGWGHQDREAFRTAFEKHWNAEHTVRPLVPVKPLKLRFSIIPTIKPAAAGIERPADDT